METVVSFLSHHTTKKSVFFFLKFSVFSLFFIAVALFVGNRIGVDDLKTQTTGAQGEEKTFTIVVDARSRRTRRRQLRRSDDGTLEKDLNLAVAMKLAALMKTADVNVVVTRDSDIELADPTSKHKKLDDLNARVAIASENENSILVSIHMNKFPISKYSGLQVYYSDNNEGSKALADMIQNGAAVNLDEKNSRKTKPAGDSIYLLSHLQIPAVLVECGFLSNYEEKELLKTDEYQTKLAMSIYTSVIEYISEDNK